MRAIPPGMTVALLLLLSASVVSAQGPTRWAQAPAATETAPGAQKLTGVAAWGQLVGNSISGQEDGETLVEYYAADGRVKSMLGNEISIGKWVLVGETICFQYD